MTKLGVKLVLYVSAIWLVSSEVGFYTDVGKFSEYPRDCRQIENFASPYGNTAISSAMTRNNISTAWVPLKRIWLKQWKWIDNSTYGYSMPHDARTKRGYNCAMLRAGDRIIVDAPCSRTLPYIICESKGIACDIKRNPYKCFVLNKKIYVIVSGKKWTWYMAKQSCTQRNMTLASFPDRDRNNIMEQVSSELGLYDKVWIGLQRVDYKVHLSDSVYESPSWFNWAINSPCVCPDKDCVIIKQDGTWQAENCSSMHIFLCNISSAESGSEIKNYTITGEANQPSKDRATTAVICVIGILAFISFITIVIVVVKKKKPCSQDIRTKNVTQLGKTDRLDQMGETEVLPSDMQECREPFIKKPGKIIGEIRQLILSKKGNLNILLIGLPKAGKSSVATRLLYELNEELNGTSSDDIDNLEEAAERTLHEKPLPIPFISDEENQSQLKKSDGLNYQNKVSIWECPGLIDENGSRIRSLLSLLMEGKLRQDVIIKDFLQKGKELSSDENVECESAQKPDIVLFSVLSRGPIPSNLLNLAVELIKTNKGLPFAVVINNLEMVEKEELDQRIKLVKSKLDSFEYNIRSVSSKTTEPSLDIYNLWTAILHEIREKPYPGVILVNQIPRKL